MLDFVSGRLCDRGADFVVIETGGVGFRLWASAFTLQGLFESSPDEPVKLLCEMVVREDELTLYGFGSAGERELFRQLTTVSGVGPRGALGILSAMAPADLMGAIVGEDAAALQSIPGVGKKTAARLIVELKERLGKMAPVPAARPQGQERAQAAAALVALGVAERQATEVVSDLSGTVEPLVREALRRLDQG